ncbi:L,D-transpeptidase family protein [Geomonas edaphica]|uniref:L,D-transpeptidase family protein n=1 Tax=Geomonas edaphica TaxID=2570226 RepID=UPI0010A7D8DF|nr:L,D-transpeptidase family protein [Geomonas edaphica]
MLRPLARLITSLGLVALATTAAQAPVDAVYYDGYLGKVFQYRVREGESLLEIGRRFDLGFNEVTAANAGVDPYMPFPGTLVTIPTAWIPPELSPRPSIVVNLAELRLYFFPKDPADPLLSFPIGIGDEGTDTPLGLYTVERKSLNPSWHVPASILQQRQDLPPVVPPGPENPLGTRALHLAGNDILIHGTNRPWGIGRRSSHGCIRLYPEDIVRLFECVGRGTQVLIVNRPVKVGLRKGKVFLEVHGEGNYQAEPGEVLHQMARLDLLAKIDIGLVVRAVSEKRGYPVEVTSIRR